MSRRLVYPKLIIDLSIIKQNVQRIIHLLGEKEIEVTAVTKGFCAHQRIVDAMIESGIKCFGDSRIDNLKKFKGVDAVKVLLRIPMLSEVNDVIKYTDISYNSELTTIMALSKSAKKQNKNHNIVIMVDMGDLREGIYTNDELYKVTNISKQLDNINLIGFGINMKCFGAIIPTKKTIKDFVELIYSIPLLEWDNKLLLSGGNSSSFYLLEEDGLEEINNLRLGESLILGTEAAFGQVIPGCKDNAFILEAEVIEVKDKPSVPIGKVAKNAFNEVPKFEDRGIIRRMICAIGSQDIDFDFIETLDSNLVILGGSSDHCIIDCSDSKQSYVPGDIVKFKLSYMSILRAMTSPYVKKEFLH